MAALQRHLRRYLRTLAQPARLPARGALPHRTTVGTPSRAPSRQLQPLASPHLPDSDSETYPWSSSSPYRRVATAACLRGGHGYHAPEAHSARPGAPGKDSTSSSSALIHRRLSRRAPEAPFGSSSCTRGTGRGAVRAMASGTAPSAVAGEGAGAPAPAPAPGVQQQPAVAAAASGPGAGAEQLSAEPPLWMQKMKVNFCRVCGGKMSLVRPEGDKEWRHVCGACGYVDYHNPKMVVGCIVEHQGQLLLCRRAIEPCRGLWTVPAGFMELHESTAAGAARETWEEAHAHVEIIAPYAHWDIPVIGQAYILFRARLAAPFTFSSGPESLEVALFRPEDIPWDTLAFSSVAVSLRLYCEDMAAGGRFRVHHGVIDKRPGSAPGDPGAFSLRDHLAMGVGVGAMGVGVGAMAGAEDGLAGGPGAGGKGEAAEAKAQGTA